jgi:hypothetical protein
VTLIIAATLNTAPTVEQGSLSLSGFSGMQAVPAARSINNIGQGSLPQALLGFRGMQAVPDDRTRNRTEPGVPALCIVRIPKNASCNCS